VIIVDFIISVISFLLLFFSLHLLYVKQGNRFLNLLLAVVLLTRCGHLVVYRLIASDQLSIFSISYKIIIPFYYAAPACLYLYFTGFIYNRIALRKFEWLHFIPVILAIIHVLPWPFSSAINWNIVAKQLIENNHFFITEKTGLFPAFFQGLVRIVLLLGYLFATWYALLTLPLVLKKKLNNTAKVWIIFLLLSSTIFQLLGLLPIFIIGFKQGTASYFWLVIINILSVLFVIIYIFYQPRLLYGYLLVAIDWKKKLYNVKRSTLPKAFHQANLFPNQLEVYVEVITKIMDNEKPFLLPEFQIIHLAQKLNIPVHQCSFIINKRMDKNFRDWVNSYRILYFICQYPSKRNKMTVESIAYESGFKSLATFYNAFKKETGMMPVAYFFKKQ
jgi:AraC-like DNA-binding protein